MRLRFLSVCLAALIGSAGLAKAETVTFSTSSGSASATAMTFSASNFTVTATAYETAFFVPNFPILNPLTITQGTKGLGVKGNGLGQNNSQIDGVGLNEFIRLTFSQTVELSSFTVANVDVTGLFKNTDGARLWEENNVKHDTFPLVSEPQTISFNQPLVGRVFTFTVIGLTDLGELSDYSLKSINATAIPLPAAPVVPLPSAASAGLLLLALAGAKRLRYRRN